MLTPKPMSDTDVVTINPGLLGTDHAIPMDNGYAAACSYSIRACITAWEKGYTIRSYYRREDYPPPAAS